MRSRTQKARQRAGIRLLYPVLGIQFLSALFFVSDLWSEVLGLRSTSIPWQWQEYIQTLASIGLVTGVIVSAVFLRLGQQQVEVMSRQIDVTSGNFQGHLTALFSQWELSPSEQSVAVYAMKGFSNIEIAELRGTSESTIKSQMNAIFKKTGLGNRQQLISFLVEDLLAGVAVVEPVSEVKGPPR